MTVADYAINPYRGCEFGCYYCYARLIKAHTRGKDSLGVKENAPHVLARELKNRNVSSVVLGSSCECFTYAESRYRLTARLLAILRDHDIPVTVLTKSPLVAEYAQQLSYNPKNRVFFTYNFSSEKIKSSWEKASPSLSARIAAMRTLAAGGISLRAHIGPFIPGASNLEEIFDTLKPITAAVNIELYHHKMGNFASLLAAVKTYDSGAAGKLAAVYRSAESYYNFSQKLKEHILKLNESYRYRIYYIVPEYDTYYNREIDYEQPLV